MSVLEEAQAGNARAFEELVAPHRRELLVHCYRMLGGVDAAEDAVQETLVAAWRGLAGFEQRSSLRAWLYRIATRCSLRLAEGRAPRLLSWDHAPARRPTDDLGAPVTDVAWLEPWLGESLDVAADGADPAARYSRREAVELAFVAALQHLPATQRAVLILRDVLAFSAAEVATLLETSPQSVNSALQRARKTLETPDRTQQVEALDAVARGTVDAFVDAFVRSDVAAVVELLTADVRFTMPPLPAWFDGRDDVAGFLEHRAFLTPWRLMPVTFSAQPSFLGYQQIDGTYRRGALMVLSFRDGRISWIASFLDPALLTGLGLPETI